MAQQTKNQIKSYFEAGDRPNDVEFGHLFDSILFLNELNQGSNTDVTSLAGGLTLGGTLTLTGTTDFKMGGNILIGNLNENLQDLFKHTLQLMKQLYLLQVLFLMCNMKV